MMHAKHLCQLPPVKRGDVPSLRQLINHISSHMNALQALSLNVPIQDLDTLSNSGQLHKSLTPLPNTRGAAVVGDVCYFVSRVWRHGNYQNAECNVDPVAAYWSHFRREWIVEGGVYLHSSLFSGVILVDRLVKVFHEYEDRLRSSDYVPRFSYGRRMMGDEDHPHTYFLMYLLQCNTCGRDITWSADPKSGSSSSSNNSISSSSSSSNNSISSSSSRPHLY